MLVGRIVLFLLIFGMFILVGAAFLALVEVYFPDKILLFGIDLSPAHWICLGVSLVVAAKISLLE